MGLFLHIAIFQNCTENAARAAVEKAGKKPGHNLIATKCQYKKSNNGVQILFNDYCAGYDELARELSEEVKRPVMLLYTYDGDYWGYYFYKNGRELDSFNPMPDYFEDVSAQEKQRLSGNSGVIAQYFNVSEDKIRNYLVPWTDERMENYKEKAYPDDGAGQCDCWQIADFMEKLGYSYDNFEFEVEANWMLKLVDGDIDDEMSPVSWSMIENGLISLRQPQGPLDDSFLILTKNPGEPDEQFLQTALPALSSGWPPVYSVQTAVNESGTVLLYEIEMSNLDEVIAFFKAYFNGGTLDLSLFKILPLYSPEQAEMGSKTNAEIDFKKERKQKIKGKLFKMFFIILSIFLIKSFSSYQLKEPVSADVFREILEAKGYEVTDITDQFSGLGYYLKVMDIDNGSLGIQFCEVESKQMAASLCEGTVALWEEDEIQTSSYAGTKYNQRYYLTNAETFYAIACYENTFILAYTDKSNKSERDVIKEIIGEVQPPNVLLIMVLFMAGGICIFLSIGFLWQEKRKRRQCDVLTIATVTGNKKKRTTDMEKDRGKKHYGASVAYSYSPVISYYANSEPIEVIYGNGLPEPIPEGTKVEILYNSKHPEVFCFTNEKQEQPFNIVAVFFCLAGLVLIGIAVNMLIKVL